VTRRVARVAVGTVVALAFVGVGILPAFAVRTVLARTTPTVVDRSGCESFPDLLAIAHNEATRRERTLDALVVLLRARHDPFALNATQLATLHAARDGVATLDQTIAQGCYRSRSTLISQIGVLFADRIYWLRVPQTQIVAAADYLAAAETRLANAATKLEAAAGSNAAARADIAAMRAALATTTQHLGAAPSISAAIAAVLGLQPARDMTRNVETIQTARTELIAARGALDAARAAGSRALAALRH